MSFNIIKQLNADAQEGAATSEVAETAAPIITPVQANVSTAANTARLTHNTLKRLDHFGEDEEEVLKVIEAILKMDMKSIFTFIETMEQKYSDVVEREFHHLPTHVANMPEFQSLRGGDKQLTEALSIEFKRFGVRAADLLPGLIDTPLLSDEVRAIAPAEGYWRLVQPAEVAAMVWRAYHEDKLHWYIPEDLRDFHAQVVAEPEVVREERAALLAAMMP